MTPEQSEAEAPALTARVILYTKPDCPDCFSAKRYLVNRHIVFLTRNIAQEEALDELLALVGPGDYSTPIIVVGDHVFSGFTAHRAHVENVLNQMGL